jgi:proton-translocating NAD(P)+ transhydrogenase subunit beta
MIDNIINLSYLGSACLFIFGLKLLSTPKTARKGNFLSSIGMLLAVVVTLFYQEIIDYTTIFAALLIGSLIGVYSAKKVEMTKIPEMVALLNGFGGLSSLLVGWAANITEVFSYISSVTIFLSILIGGVTFTGSIIAWAKLSEKISGKPITFALQKIINFLLLAALVTCGILFSYYQGDANYLYLTIGGSLLLGILLVIPIGGADMPVVISLLNSYSGIAACAAGFVIKNNVLIVSGSLVGASGIILTSIMCKAMNRSLKNVLFSGFGSVKSNSKDSAALGDIKSISPQDAYHVLEAAKSVLIVPGYGLAVAQAQHIVKEFSELLQKNGTEVKYAIHSVAGRMPGHMNVLLAEAGVSYDLLAETDDVNPTMATVDVCLVIGANDVVNPAAIEDKDSVIYGMPIIEAHNAQHVFILKRSMGSGFAGIVNSLFYRDNSSMIFGDAKKTLQELVSEFKN